MEQWKDIKGWVGYYQVSDLGRVRSIDRVVIHKNRGHKQFKRGKLLKSVKTKKGYLSVDLVKQGLRKSVVVHRLVALTFIDNKHKKPQVNHKDGNKLNNHLSNLEWVTNKENIQHAFKLGLKESPMKGKYGKDHNRSVSIIQKSKQGEFIKEFASISDAYRETHINLGNIQSACCGRVKTAGGYKWEYKENN